MKRQVNDPLSLKVYDFVPFAGTFKYVERGQNYITEDRSEEKTKFDIFTRNSFALLLYSCDSCGASILAFNGLVRGIESIVK